MYGIFDKPLKQIEADDIQSLLDRNEREGQYLEYKLKESKEGITTDICAMANAQGGYIILGISEKPSENLDGEGYPSEIKGVSDAHNLERSLKEKTKDLIDPQIPGYDSRVIQINNKQVIIVQIPNSPVKPHFVRNSNKGPFPVRVARATYSWSMGDVRNQVISHINADERIEKLINRTLEHNPCKILNMPMFSILALPTYEGIDTLSIDLEQNKDFIFQPHKYSLNRPVIEYSTYQRYTLNGIENYNEEKASDGKKTIKFIQLHRNGMIEFSYSFYIYENFPDIDRIGSSIFAIAAIYAHFAKSISYFGPVTFCVNIFNIKDTYIRLTEINKLTEDSGNIEFQISYPTALEDRIPKDICLRIVNAFGLNILINDWEDYNNRYLDLISKLSKE
jgi:hypothetical protein